MALTLDATVKGVSANSYVTEAAADTYFEGRYGADSWTAADSATKKLLLVSATTQLERETWEGSPTTTTQALKWPRAALYDEEGNAVDEDTIPARIIQATCELALALLDGNAEMSGAGALQSLNSISIGPVSLSGSGGSSSATIPGAVASLIGFWCLSGRAGSRWYRA